MTSDRSARGDCERRWSSRIPESRCSERNIVVRIRDGWLGRGFVIDTIVEQDDAERLATARTHEPGDSEGIVVDLLFASSGIEQEIAAAAEVLELVPGLEVPVAQPGHLFVLKLLSRDRESRPQDDVDLRNLAEILSDGDIELARNAAALIEARGFSRGRDLLGAIDQWI